MTDRLIITLIKGAERYVFLYDDTAESRSACLRTLSRFASNPELSFTWLDAATCSQCMEKSKRREVTP